MRDWHAKQAGVSLINLLLWHVGERKYSRDCPHFSVVVISWWGGDHPAGAVRGRRSTLTAAGTHVAAPGAVASSATHHHHGEAAGPHDSGVSRYRRRTIAYEWAIRVICVRESLRTGFLWFLYKSFSVINLFVQPSPVPNSLQYIKPLLRERT